jgi:GDP-4-dehydro-6-deoxy-D-mannose reductase
MSKKILITGAEGFIGFHLIAKLDKLNKFKVFASYKRINKRLEKFKNTKIIQLDVRKYNQIKKTLTNIQPDIIINLAAQSEPMRSWKYKKYTFDTNLYGTLNFLDCQKKGFFKGKLVLISTSGQYGYSLPTNKKVSEKSVMTPCHPYGISKLASELLAYNFYKNYNSKVIFARVFNTTGPFKRNDFISDIGLRIKKKIIKSSKKVIDIPVGNLHTKRAYLHVNDTINALLMIANSDHYGEAFNISNSKAFSGHDIIQIYEKLLKIKINPIPDTKFIRKNDEKIIIGDIKKIYNYLGWSPNSNLSKTILDVYQNL